GHPQFFVGVHPPLGGQVAQTCRGDVLAHVLDEVQAVELAVLRGVGDARADRLRHGAGVDLSAMHEYLTADPATVRLPEDAHRQLGTAGAHQTGDAHHLTTADGEVGPIDDAPAGLGGVMDGPVL